MFQSISTSWGRIKFRFQGPVLGRLGVEAFHAALRRHQPGFHWSLATGPASMPDGPQLYGNFSRVTDDKLSRFFWGRPGSIKPHEPRTRELEDGCPAGSCNCQLFDSMFSLAANNV